MDLSPRVEPLGAVRTRRRLSRTFTRARWDEYARLLDLAQRSDYTVLSLEDWMLHPARWAGRRTLLLRHDVDQHPRSALIMSDLEVDAGVTSTWYFRWRTAHADLIGELRRRGGAVGLHYETLSREVLARGELPAREMERMLSGARHVLRGEIEAFAARYGPMLSVCPHGDSRVPSVRNADLLLGEDWSTYGIRFDAHLEMRNHELGAWMTDRSRAEGGWKPGTDPQALMGAGVSPILALVHPNNWVSGPSLWTDRLLARALRAPRHDPRAPARPMRTGTDLPPV